MKSMTSKIFMGLGACATILTLLSLSSLLIPTRGRTSDLATTLYHRDIAAWVSDPVIEYIVVGQVISKGESRIIPDTVTPIEFQKRIEENGGLAGYIATDYTFQVLLIVKGKNLRAGDTITVVQIGGSVNGLIQETPVEPPPLEVGERAILSLFYDPRDPTVSPDHKKYAVITQPEVRYRINNGRIELMPGEWQDISELEEFVKLRRLSEVDFVQIIEKEQASSEP